MNKNDSSFNKAHRLISGEMGSEEGKRIAAFLDKSGHRDIVVEFYVWVDTRPGTISVFLAKWLEEHHPELLMVYRARKRVTG